MHLGRLGSAASALLPEPLVLPARAMSPTVAAVVGFWVSGGVAAYVRYGPHAKEIDPVLKDVLVATAICGIVTTSILLSILCIKDRELKYTFKQTTDAFGGVMGLVCCCLARLVLADTFMTVLIPDSLTMMTYLVPETYPTEMLSGLMISSCRFGMMVGVLLAYPVVQGKWNQRRLKYTIVASSAIFSLALVAMAVACYDTRADPQIHPTKPKTARLVTIFISQLCAGMSQGLVVTGVRLMVNRLTPPKSQMTVAIVVAVLVCAGTGLGPMLSNSVRVLLMTTQSGTPPTTPIVCGVSLSVVAVLSVLWIGLFTLVSPVHNDGMPIPLGTRGPDSQLQLGENLIDEHVEKKQAAQKKLFITSLIVTTERAWLVAGLEAVTAMVMQEEFEISDRDIGFAVGSCFIIATPFVVLGGFAKQVMKPSTLTVVLGFLVVFLCVLIFHFPAELLHLRDTASLAFLLVADTLIYPAALTLGGVVQGLALGYAIIPGSRIYSSAVAIGLSEMLASGVGRFLSMPLSRLIVARGGRDTYAGVQLGMAFLSLLSCIRLAPTVRFLAEDGNEHKR